MLAEQLAEWSLGVDAAVVPKEVVDAATAMLADALAVGLGATRLRAVPALDAIAASATAPAVATALGFGRRPVGVAAMINGVQIHALDWDDTHAGGLVHTSAPVWPVALAVGEEVGASGLDVLLAGIVGIEIIARLGAAAPHAFHARGVHATAVCGVFAATVVACRLRGLDVATTVNAMGIAGSRAAGSLEFLSTGSSTKQLHPGFAAADGILAATLAAAGATGPATILEGRAGLFRTLADREVDPAAVVAGLGEDWAVTQLGVKPHPTCQLTHAAIDAAASLSPLAAGDIVSVVVDLPRDAVDIVAEPAADKRRPRGDYDRRFSLPWCVATALVTGGVTLDGTTTEPDADLFRVMDRVEYVVTDPGVPAAAAPGRVQVRLTDGSVVVADVTSSRGTVANPMSPPELRAKFQAATGGADGLWTAIHGLNAAPDLAELVANLPTDAASQDAQ